MCRPVSDTRSGQYIRNFANLVLSVQFLDLPTHHPPTVICDCKSVKLLTYREKREWMVRHCLPTWYIVHLMYVYNVYVRVSGTWEGLPTCCLNCCHVIWQVLITSHNVNAHKKPTIMDVYIQTPVGQFLMCAMASIQFAPSAPWVQFL